MHSKPLGDKRAIAFTCTMHAFRLSIGCFLLLTACSSEVPAPLAAPATGFTGATPSAAATQPHRGGTLTFASFGDIRALDPANVTDGLAPQVLQGLFSGLVDFDHDGKVTADLADRFTVDASATSYRFILREGVRLHDGEELTADDIKRSVERALHPSAPNPMASRYASLRGYEAFSRGQTETLDGVRVEGRYVVSFDLEHPDASFVPLLAMHAMRPVCKSAGHRFRDNWHPCGAGPFRLLPGGWERSRHVTLVRHNQYFRPGLPYLDSVRWIFQVTPRAQQFRFAAGQQDVLRDFVGPDLLRFQADPRWKDYGAFDSDQLVGGIVMNTEMEPFNNIEIRRAVAAAVDRNTLRYVRAANLRPAYGPLPPTLEGYSNGFESQQSNLDLALEHMKRAGHPYDPLTKTGGWPHTITYVTYAKGLDEQLAQVMIQQLERIGIRLRLSIVNYPTFLALRGRRHEVAASAGFWIPDYPEAGGMLEPLFHSQSIHDEDSTNASFYANSRVDALLDQAKREIEPRNRTAMYRDVQSIVCSEAPWAFTYSYRFYAQWQPYVRNFRPHPTWLNDASRVWLNLPSTKQPTSARMFFHSVVDAIRGRSTPAPSLAATASRAEPLAAPHSAGARP